MALRQLKLLQVGFVCTRLIFVLVLSAGCTSNSDEASGRDFAPASAPQTPPAENIGVILDRYRNSTDCRGGDYYKIQSMVEETPPGANEPGLFEVHLMIKQALAKDMLEVAAEAESKGCPKTARATYLFVIDTFIGSAFAAARQRAQIGIDDLRAEQVSPIHRTNPTDS